MDDPDLIRLDLQISAGDATSDEVDDLTRHMLAELRDQDVESVQLVSAGPAPDGAKSAEALTAGAIAISVLPAALPKLIDFVQAWVMRAQGRTVKFKGKISGQAIEFEGSPEALQGLLKTLQKGKPR